MQIDCVGPYDLVERIGVGGMAETFIAIRRGPVGFEQRVCIKVILEDRANDPSFVGPFLDEARLLARMRCANIVQVHDFGESRGTYYMALELVEGVDLDRLLRDARSTQERLPMEACLFVAAELLAAIAYAHELSADGLPLAIIHRDISPSNVLLSAHGEVKLTDFGIAKARGRVHKTKTGLIKGKLPYMSPEQVRGEPLTQSTDLFSAGVVLYELLSGEHPFEGPGDAAVVHRIMTAEHRPIRDIAPHLPHEVSELVESLLAHSPQGRPASARIALTQLSNHVRFVAGQQLLAERVARCLEKRARHNAQSTHFMDDERYNTEQPSVRQRTPSLKLDDDAGPDFVRTAKNTTARPPRPAVRRTTPASRIAVIGVGLGALALATGVWVTAQRSDSAPAAELPSLPAPTAPVADTSEQKAGVALPLPLGEAVPAEWPLREEEPLSTPPVTRPSPTAPAEPKQGRPIPRDTRSSKKLDQHEAGIEVSPDSGVPRGRWSDVTPDQF